MNESKHSKEELISKIGFVKLGVATVRDTLDATERQLEGRNRWVAPVNTDLESTITYLEARLEEYRSSTASALELIRGMKEQTEQMIEIDVWSPGFAVTIDMLIVAACASTVQHKKTCRCVLCSTIKSRAKMVGSTKEKFLESVPTARRILRSLRMLEGKSPLIVPSMKEVKRRRRNQRARERRLSAKSPAPLPSRSNPRKRAAGGRR